MQKSNGKSVAFFEDKRLLSQFHDGIFETFGSKIRDEIPKEVAPVRTN